MSLRFRASVFCRAIRTGTLLAGCLLTLPVLLTACASTDLHTTPAVYSAGKHERASPGEKREDSLTLKVMTLNLAHGRGDSFHQLLQNVDQTLNNLDTVTATLLRERPDLLALQEADAASFWSGNLNHVDYLAANGPLTQSVHGKHADGFGLCYGTALLSRLDLHGAEAITFDPSLTITPKGFVVSTITWPGKPGIEVDIVSAHLDFSSEEIRRSQATELIQKLALRKRPLVLMGDFNTEWGRTASAVEHIVSELGLIAFRPEAENMDTFPALDRRLDWILVSPEFGFKSYRVLADVLSDHRGVIAELTLHVADQVRSAREPVSESPAAEERSPSFFMTT